jgi:hypothetical protein
MENLSANQHPRKTLLGILCWTPIVEIIDGFECVWRPDIPRILTFSKMITINWEKLINYQTNHLRISFFSNSMLKLGDEP